MNCAWSIAKTGIALALVIPCLMNCKGSERLEAVRDRIQPSLKQQWVEAGLQWGASVFIRIFKESSELEVWGDPGGGAEWIKFRTYPIACFSGELGPKLREGDGQAPEGIYATNASLLNPQSRYHLSFNIGYPNALERQLGRTGSLIMIHGSDVSVGCFAMTDPQIEEIYLFVEAALRHGAKTVPIHCFPFRMTDARLQQARDDSNPWTPFWEELQPIHDAFERTLRPPTIESNDGRYQLSED